jgi:hypothetical protein
VEVQGKTLETDRSAGGRHASLPIGEPVITDATMVAAMIAIGVRVHHNAPSAREKASLTTAARASSMVGKVPISEPSGLVARIVLATFTSPNQSLAL